MHEKCSKIDFFANFRKLQKKLPICKKRYAEILRTGGAVVTNVEKKSKTEEQNFFRLPFRATICSTAKTSILPKNRPPELGISLGSRDVLE